MVKKPKKPLPPKKKPSVVKIEASAFGKGLNSLVDPYGNSMTGMQEKMMQQLMNQGLESQYAQFASTPRRAGKSMLLENAQMKFAVETLSKKHMISIEVTPNTPGDYIEFRTYGRGVRQNSVFRLSRTQMVTVRYPGQLIDIIEKGLNLDNGGWDKEAIKKVAFKDKSKNPTEDWADKWSREHGATGATT